MCLLLTEEKDVLGNDILLLVTSLGYCTLVPNISSRNPLSSPLADNNGKYFIRFEWVKNTGGWALSHEAQ